MKRIRIAAIVLAVCLGCSLFMAGSAFAADKADKKADAKEPELTIEDVANIYYPVASSDGKYCVDMQDEYADGDGVITLSRDGTGSMMTGNIENKLCWDLAENVITVYDEMRIVPIFKCSIEDGILTVDFSTENADGSENIQISYWAVEDADLSVLSLITLEEYQSLLKG